MRSRSSGVFSGKARSRCIRARAWRFRRGATALQSAAIRLEAVSTGSADKTPATTWKPRYSNCVFALKSRPAQRIRLGARRVARQAGYPGRGRSVILGRGRASRPGRAPMKKFLVVYMADRASFEAMMHSATPEQRQAGMAAWMKWMTQHQAALVDGGAPLGPTKRVTAAGVTDARNEMGGYSIVQAESHEAATQMFGKDFPHLQMPGAWIEVVEIMPIPGM